MISEETFEMLTVEVDAQLDELPVLPEQGNAPTQFVEVTLRPDSHAVGKAIAELNLPRAAVFVSIRREEEIIVPRGDTLLEAGDIVTTLCERESVAAVRKLLVSRIIPRTLTEPKSG